MIKSILPVLAIPLSFLLVSCEAEEKFTPALDTDSWAAIRAKVPEGDSLIHGKSYLSVYAQMYSYNSMRKYNLTNMISLRNVSEEDTIYLLRADYYNTHGDKIRTYFDHPVYVVPQQTLEIIIEDKDDEGGTGSNFVFEWKTPQHCPEPLFEGVMNSMDGGQGIAFTTHAVRIE
jgi:hypothetical protein